MGNYVLVNREPNIGDRVEVFTANAKTRLGYGTYHGKVLIKETEADGKCGHTDCSVKTEGFDEDIDTDDVSWWVLAGFLVETPKIIMDNGQTFYGYECWWQTVVEQIHIVGAAIKAGAKICSMPPPHSHTEIRQQYSSIDNFDALPGFLTSGGEFVDRYEAAKIALAAGQISAYDLQLGLAPTQLGN